MKCGALVPTKQLLFQRKNGPVCYPLSSKERDPRAQRTETPGHKGEIPQGTKEWDPMAHKGPINREAGGPTGTGGSWGAEPPSKIDPYRKKMCNRIDPGNKIAARILSARIALLQEGSGEGRDHLSRASHKEACRKDPYRKDCPFARRLGRRPWPFVTC